MRYAIERDDRSVQTIEADGFYVNAPNTVVFFRYGEAPRNIATPAYDDYDTDNVYDIYRPQIVVAAINGFRSVSEMIAQDFNPEQTGDTGEDI